MTTQVGQMSPREFIKLFADGKKPTQAQFKAFTEYLIQSEDNTDKEMLDIIARIVKHELDSRPSA